MWASPIPTWKRLPELNTANVAPVSSPAIGTPDRALDVDLPAARRRRRAACRRGGGRTCWDALRGRRFSTSYRASLKIAAQVMIGIPAQLVRQTAHLHLGNRHRHALPARHFRRTQPLHSFPSGRTRRNRRLPAVAAQDQFVKNSSDSLARAPIAAPRFKSCGRSSASTFRNLYGITEGGYVLSGPTFPSPLRGGTPIPPVRCVAPTMASSSSAARACSAATGNSGRAPGTS